MTNEEIKKILDGAPEGATHYAQGMHYLAYNSSENWMRYDPSGIGGFCWFDANEFKFSYTKSFHNLTDLREILELRQEVERLKKSHDDVINAFDCGNDDDLQHAVGRMVDQLREQSE